MVLSILAGVVLILCFISAVNYHFQKLKYKYTTDEVMKTLPFFEAPSTWSFFSILLSFILLVIICLEIGYMGRGLSNVSNQQNNINQYQKDTSIQNTDNGQTN